MTKQEAAVASVYTGVAFLGGEDFHYIHEYMEELLGMPLMTSAIPMYQKKLEELAKPDFIEMCEKIAEEEK